MADNQRAVSPIILILGGVLILIATGYALWVNVLSGDRTEVAQGEETLGTEQPTSYPTDYLTEGDPGLFPTESPEPQVTEGLDGVDQGAEDASSSILPETFEVYTHRDPFMPLIRGEQSSIDGSNIDSYVPQYPRENGYQDGFGAYTPGGSNQSAGTQGYNPYAPQETPGQVNTQDQQGANTTGQTGSVQTGNGAPLPQNGQPPSPGTPSGETSQSVGTSVGGQVEVGATRVRLQDVPSSDRVVVTVNGVDYNPGIGEAFADRFKLLSVDVADAKKCATMLFGDSRFHLCAGQVIDK